ncbi:MAG: hypothetical protein OEL55_06565, partial [Desulfobulbaceae bacterium]|nr:hypothetical protein [Desulfobulbaceae bacterium]
MKVSRSTRSILITALGVGLICSVPTVSMARVKGVCANCHTMHASQQNDGRKAFTGTTTTPRTGLLANDCYGCHTDSSASFNLFSSIGAPLVVVTQGPNATDTLLPGGFIEINATEETQHSISAVTGTGLSSPPGWNAGDSSATNSHRDGITWTN